SDLRFGGVHWVTGTAAPCTGVFKPIVLNRDFPGHGPRPGPDEDAESLWWRHEQLRRKLEVCDAELRRQFNEERNELELRFINDVGMCSTATVVRERVIADCWHDALEFESKWFERL